MTDSFYEKVKKLQDKVSGATARIVSVTQENSTSFSGDVGIIFADGVCEKCLGDTHGISTCDEPLVMKCERCGHEIKCD